MNNALLVYATTSGNTYLLAQAIQKGVEESGWQTELKNVKEVNLNELGKYELLMLGSSTWNTGGKQGQLQKDMYAFVEQNEGVNLKGKQVAVFGVGHYSYTFPVQAVDTLVKFVLSHNGRIIGEVFKVDDVVDLFMGRAEEWGRSIALAHKKEDMLIPCLLRIEL